MSLLFYMDHHVRRAITRGLRARGVDVITAQEDGFAAASDEAILARAKVATAEEMDNAVQFIPLQ
jgi:hypothetical protein